jgi:ribonucleoside-diphosphate reductase beta chain
MDNMQIKEELLQDESNRYTLFPIKYPRIWQAYETQESAFWTAKEIDYAADLADWSNLDADEKYFVEHILAFFAGSDGIVMENLLLNFCDEVKAPEARAFYSLQSAMEGIHSQVYSLLIETYVKDPKRKEYLFNAIETIPCVAKKANWAIKWISDKQIFHKRLIAFAVVEGIFFSGSFCAIFWLKSRGKMVKGLGMSNEFIARDEGLHTDFAVLLYDHLNYKVPQAEVEEIFREAVDIETEFICESLPCRLIGMNSELMSEYIRFVADRLLVQLGYQKIYNVENPFSFMKKNNLDGKTNFFEKRVSEYTSSLAQKKEDQTFEIDDDF